MPVRGSTAAASCLKRPSAFSGSGSTIPLALAGTEHISVRLFAIEKGLLARQPASPRRDAARAVDRRARKAQMLALHLSGRHVIDDGGRTARQRLARRALCIDARALHRAPGKGALALRSGFQFMVRSEEHTSELQSLMRISYAVFCLKKKKKH